MLGTTRQHGLDSVQGNSQADQTNARLETAPFCPVTAVYKMEHCCFCEASRGAGKGRKRSLALPGARGRRAEGFASSPPHVNNKPARTQLIFWQEEAEQ